MAKPPNKRYIVRKYVMARTAQEALRKERSLAPDDVWIDSEWQKENPLDNVSRQIGFSKKVLKDS